MFYYVLAWDFIVLLFVFWYLFLHRPKYDLADSYFARILKYSKAEHTGVIAVSYHLIYPRFIHSEMMTHKDFSRSAASSRAIPVIKVLKQVWSNPAMPVYWGMNMPGMKAKDELQGWRRTMAINLWRHTGKAVCVFVYLLVKLNLHKQLANRLLEPWQLMQVTLTTAKLKNFFKLRIHQDAQPEINHLAQLMRYDLRASTPKILKFGQWHLPWVDDLDINPALEMSKKHHMPVEDVLIRISAARCARSSYGIFEGDRDLLKDLNLYDKLVSTEPVHASPAEHQVTPDQIIEDVWHHPELHGNMIGWVQHRKLIPNHYTED